LKIIQVSTERFSGRVDIKLCTINYVPNHSNGITAGK